MLSCDLCVVSVKNEHRNTDESFEDSQRHVLYK